MNLFHQEIVTFDKEAHLINEMTRKRKNVTAKGQQKQAKLVILW